MVCAINSVSENSASDQGLRYYSPSLGRFINQDPSGEQGGLNLYAFCRNKGVNAWDYLGMGEHDQNNTYNWISTAGAGVGGIFGIGLGVVVIVGTGGLGGAVLGGVILASGTFQTAGATSNVITLAGGGSTTDMVPASGIIGTANYVINASTGRDLHDGDGLASGGDLVVGFLTTGVPFKFNPSGVEVISKTADDWIGATTTVLAAVDTGKTLYDGGQEGTNTSTTQPTGPTTRTTGPIVHTGPTIQTPPLLPLSQDTGGIHFTIPNVTGDGTNGTGSTSGDGMASGTALQLDMFKVTIKAPPGVQVQPNQTNSNKETPGQQANTAAYLSSEDTGSFVSAGDAWGNVWDQQNKKGRRN